MKLDWTISWPVWLDEKRPPIPRVPRLLQNNQRKSLTAVMRNLEDLAPATIKSPDAQPPGVGGDLSTERP